MQVMPFKSVQWRSGMSKGLCRGFPVGLLWVHGFLCFLLQTTLLSFTVSGVFKEGQYLCYRTFKVGIIYNDDIYYIIFWGVYVVVYGCKQDCFLSVTVEGKSRDCTMAFSRVFVTVPAGNSGWASRPEHNTFYWRASCYVCLVSILSVDLTTTCFT